MNDGMSSESVSDNPIDTETHGSWNSSTGSLIVQTVREIFDQIFPSRVSIWLEVENLKFSEANME